MDEYVVHLAEACDEAGLRASGRMLRQLYAEREQARLVAWELHRKQWPEGRGLPWENR